MYPDNELYNSAAEFELENGFTQLVTQPTRTSNILVIILTANPLSCDDVYYLQPLASSDHCVVACNLSVSLFACDSQKKQASGRYNFGKANWLGLSAHLPNVNLQFIFANSTSTDEVWGQIYRSCLCRR